ncbi:formate dehydrogenase accessory sulfurtransferase FdhD [Flavobacterium sp. LC2016-01]|uniref:formate dehydrogenase accessory sulfurtransferase FdhD n=1 Tax=Flavobacterium sp. LC2016-01 TaxID=2675876 RepID=UPI0012BAF40B|nr:formate dehydrogenase accessory sulfurtransferase FdhD [Flavobacterium sp. LC2016-01]MTH17725.1 formate dehydrogenase accessory sulfurtransferase FdhD [Flavobacterium sp. LC2016-01]
MKMNDSELVSIKNISLQKVNGFESSFCSDILSVEEPLEIRLRYGSQIEKTQKNISVTMRTPGDDFDLAVGFLFTEGIISSYQDLVKIYHIEKDCQMQKKNIVQADLKDDLIPVLMHTDRNFYTTSSCGVCGKSSIESIKTTSSFNHINKAEITVFPQVLYQLPKKLMLAQTSFASTGGIHASGLFSIEGDLLLLREDVGRHNALDKLIGSALAKNLLPLDQYILVLSGRASFELIQKAAMAGISIVAAIGAPSSLAVELAREFNITLLGFLKDGRFNIYNSGNHVLIPISNKN